MYCEHHLKMQWPCDIQSTPCKETAKINDCNLRHPSWVNLACLQLLSQAFSSLLSALQTLIVANFSLRIRFWLQLWKDSGARIPVSSRGFECCILGQYKSQTHITATKALGLVVYVMRAHLCWRLLPFPSVHEEFLFFIFWFSKLAGMFWNFFRQFSIRHLSTLCSASPSRHEPNRNPSHPPPLTFHLPPLTSHSPFERTPRGLCGQTLVCSDPSLASYSLRMREEWNHWRSVQAFVLEISMLHSSSTDQQLYSRM